MMFDTAEAVALALRETSPTSRARAVAWLKAHPNAIGTTELVEAIQKEPVRQLRESLETTLRARQRGSVSGGKDAIAPLSENKNVLEDLDLASTLLHELTPAIGWIRHASSREVPNFESSRTYNALSKLQRRLDGIVTLLKGAQGLQRTEVSLDQLIQTSWPDEELPHVVSEAGTTSACVFADANLLVLVLSNAFQNAIDASLKLARVDEISVAYGAAGGKFWIRVTNPFEGSYLNIRDVVGVGMSTNSGPRGQGLALMQEACALLGFGLKLEGSSGVAAFYLTGSNNLA